MVGEGWLLLLRRPRPASRYTNRGDLDRDSAIIAAARAMGCTEVLSEDMGNGEDYAGVRVTNPFR